jgi:hypothetical protein
MTAYLDARTIAADVRMQRQVHKGSFLLIEGTTDYKRLRKIIDEGRCCIIICFGKENVVGAVDALTDDGTPGILGLVDADFDRILNRLPVADNLIVSQAHDYDLDIMMTNALDRYFFEVADEAKLKAASSVGARSVFVGVLESLRPLSALRYANERDQLGYRLTDLDIADFFDGTTIDVVRLVEACSWGRFGDPASKQKIAATIARYARLNLDLYQITSGHDACAAVGIALRVVIGRRKKEQTSRSEIEMHMRLAIDRGDLDQCGLLPKIRQWEADNVPYGVLSS